MVYLDLGGILAIVIIRKKKTIGRNVIRSDNSPSLSIGDNFFMGFI